MSEPYPWPHVLDKVLAPLCVRLPPVVAPVVLHIALYCHHPVAKVRDWPQGILTCPPTVVMVHINIFVNCLNIQTFMKQYNCYKMMKFISTSWLLYILVVTQSKKIIVQYTSLYSTRTRTP